MDTFHYNNCLSSSLFIDSKNDSNEDTTSDEEIDVGEEEPAPTGREYELESEDEEDSEDDDDDDEEDTEHNQFTNKRIGSSVAPRSRYNARSTKTVKKKRNHNNMERVRREKVSMCYSVLRRSMGVKDVSRNRSLEVASDLIKQYKNRLKEVDEKIEDYENKIKSLMNSDVGMMPNQSVKNKYGRH